MAMRDAQAAAERTSRMCFITLWTLVADYTKQPSLRRAPRARLDIPPQQMSPIMVGGGTTSGQLERQRVQPRKTNSKWPKASEVSLVPSVRFTSIQFLIEAHLSLSIRLACPSPSFID